MIGTSDMPTTEAVVDARSSLLPRRLRRGRVAAQPSATAAMTDLRGGELQPLNLVLPFPPAGRVASDVDGAPPSRRGGEVSGTPPQRGAESPVAIHRMSHPQVSVVIPTYNEARNLPGIMNRIPSDYEVVIVDGCSVDDTVEVARSLRPDATIVMQNRRGKGNAMACGFAAVTGDIIVMLDADGSAAPEEISRFVDALLAGADFAKGSRFAPGGGSTDITRLRAWGNRWLNRAANLLFGTRYTDLCYGYNAFWRHCLDDLELDPHYERDGDRLWGDGFEIETIINTRMAKARMRITEVPSFEFTRVHGESNLNTWRDGMRVLRALVVERVNGVGRQRQHDVARPVAVGRDTIPTPRASDGLGRLDNTTVGLTAIESSVSSACRVAR